MATRNRIEAAIQRCLYPVVKLLLEYGVTESHFQNIARSVFVKVAAEEIENSPVEVGNKATAARIAVMTGIPRNVIKPILESKHVIGQDEWYRHLCAEILTAWHTTPEYLHPNGSPIPIPFEGPAPSFVALTELHESRSRSSVSPNAILDELKLVGAVDEVPADPDNPEDENTLLVAREKIFRRVGSKLEDLESAMDDLYNMASAKHEIMLKNSKQVFAGDVVTLEADSKETKVLLRDLRNAASQLLKSSKDTMSRKRLKPGDRSSEPRRVGIGVYVYGEDEMAKSRFFSTTTDEQEDQKIANE